jgi:hypothetical protein
MKANSAHALAQDQELLWFMKRLSFMPLSPGVIVVLLRCQGIQDSEFCQQAPSGILMDIWA